jgi:hypothetical protein
VSERDGELWRHGRGRNGDDVDGDRRREGKGACRVGWRCDGDAQGAARGSGGGIERRGGTCSALPVARAGATPTACAGHPGHGAFPAVAGRSPAMAVLGSITRVRGSRGTWWQCWRGEGEEGSMCKVDMAGMAMSMLGLASS